MTQNKKLVAAIKAVFIPTTWTLSDTKTVKEFALFVREAYPRLMSADLEGEAVYKYSQKISKKTGKLVDFYELHIPLKGGDVFRASVSWRIKNDFFGDGTETFPVKDLRAYYLERGEQSTWVFDDKDNPPCQYDNEE